MIDPATLTFLDRVALVYWLALAFLACGALWFAVGALREIGRGTWLALRAAFRALRFVASASETASRGRPCGLSCEARAKREARRAKHGLPCYAAFQSKIGNQKSKIP